MGALPNRGVLTPRQLVTALADGEVYVMSNGVTIGAQVGRSGEVYYVCGPEFEQWNIDLKKLLQMPDFEEEVYKANAIIGPDFPDAQIFICEGLQDALETLTGLFAAAQNG